MFIKIDSVMLSNHTIGKLSIDGVFFFYTMELQWLDNKANISCIPAGDYIIKMVNSPRFGRCYEVTNVVGRSHILIHSGNTTDDIQGCILLGGSTGILNINGSLNEAVLSSRPAVRAFNDMLGDKEHTLQITRA